MSMLELLGALWPRPPADAALTIWELPDKDSLHYPIVDVLACTEDDVADLIRQLEGHDVYFGLGLRQLGLDTHTRGHKKHVNYLPGFAIDIDLLSPGAHKATNLPQTDEDVDRLMQGAPAPTAIVHTGNGLHGYFCFPEPLRLTCKAERDAAAKAFEAFQEPFIERAKELGWQLDKTASIDRVWRLPGFVNQKRAPYPVVHLLHADPSTRSIELPHAKYKKPAAGIHQERKLADTIPNSTIDKLKHLKDPDRKKLFDDIFAGKSFAPAGDRDNALQRAASMIAWADEGKTEPEVLAEILRPSLQVWANEPDAEKDIDDELEKAIEKINRAAQDYQTKHAHRLREIDSLRDVLTPGSEPTFKHLALQQDNTFYVYSFEDKKYWPAHTARELPIVLRDAWPEGSPTDLTYYNAKGEVKKKTMPMVLDEYATAIREAVYSLSESKTIYDPKTRVLRVPTGTMRPLVAQYHEQIDEWLQLMPARKHHLEMFLDWLATVTRLDKMSAALYLSGPKSTGKSLLVAGLARLWNRGPTKLEHVFRRFNASLLNCPLINVDESWHDQSVNICAELREIVGNMTHQVEPKGRPVVTLEGAVRLIITANNETLLNTRGNGDQNQLERDATIERILHVPTSDAAASFLKSVKDRHRWREENMIAEHVLWLRDQRAEDVIDRALNEGHRFLIQGDPTDAEFYDGIGSRPKDHDAAVQWLSALLTRKPVPVIKNMIKIEHGKFTVVPRALCLSWESFGLAKHFDTPTSSNAATRILRPFTGARTKLGDANAYKIDIDRFVRAARTESLVPLEVLEKKLGIDGSKY